MNINFIDGKQIKYFNDKEPNLKDRNRVSAATETGVLHDPKIFDKHTIG